MNEKTIKRNKFTKSQKHVKNEWKNTLKKKLKTIENKTKQS